MIEWWKALTLAGVGGLLPTLSKLAGSFTAQPDQPLPGWHFLLGLLIFFVLGCTLNGAFNKDNDLPKALTIGIAAPALITNIIAGVTNAPTQPTQPKPQIVSFLERVLPIGTALAQSSDSSTRKQNPSAPSPIEVSVQWKIDGYPNLGTPVIAVMADDQKVGTVFIGNPTTILVPAGAHTLTFVAGGVSSTAVPIPEGATNIQVLATVTTRVPGESDFLWALGRSRESVPVSISLQLVQK